MLQDPPNAIMEDDSKFSAASVEEPHDHDLICGRGGKVNAHPGNRRFRSLVNDRKEAYTRAYGKGEKNAIAQSILQVLFSLNPPGRVLQFDNKNGTYTEVTVKKAMGKTTQALREGAPELRKKNGLPPPKELSRVKKISSTSDHLTSEGRPKVVHIKGTRRFLSNDADHEYDASSYDASSSSSGSVGSGMRISCDGEHTSTGVDAGGPGRKHDHFSHHANTDVAGNKVSSEYDYNHTGPSGKKPRLVGATSSSDEEEGASQKISTPPSPPISDSASLLYALATTCAKQVPSIESPSASGQEDAPPDKRLITPETGRGLSRRVWTDRHKLSCTSLSSSVALTPAESIRLEKEKTVESFLITSVPCIYMDDVRTYTTRLVDDGFDSLQMLMNQLEEDDLHFMKKAHKRALLQVIRKEHK